MSVRDSDVQHDGAPPEWDTPPPPTSNRRHRRLRVAALVAAVALVGVWAFMTWPTPDRASLVTTRTDGARTDSVRLGLSVFPVGERAKAPTLEGDTVEGSALQAERLRGKIVVVNVWGSWCVPCRAEAPDLARVARETEGKGVTFLGIDVRDDRGSARAFTRRYSIHYESLFDPDGRQLAKFSSIIPINAVPSTVIVDRSGRVAARVVGPVEYKTLSGLVQDVLAEPAGGPA